MAQIHPTAIIDEKAQIASSVEIGPYCIIGPDVKIDDNVKLHAHVVIEGHTSIGTGCEIFSFACLGKEPQHLRYDGEPAELIIGKNNIIREHVTMHIGTAIGNMKTVIGDNGMFMVASHVAHDCIVGDNFILAQNSALGGHCEVGDNVYFGAYSAAHPFVKIGHSAIIGGLTAVVANVIPYGNVYGERGYLNGVNLIGMKRRGMSKDEMRLVKHAYDAIFTKEGVFADNVAQIAKDYGDVPAIGDIVSFIEEGAERSLCLAKKS